MRTARSCPDPGFTLIELLIVVAVIATIAAIAVPGLLRARLSANQASAIASLRVISSAEQNYAATCANDGYAIDLADLLKPAPNSSAAFLGPDLARNGVQKSGYTFALAKDGGPSTRDVTQPTCNGAAQTPASAFVASADPIRGGQDPHYATDRRGTIFYDTAAIANPIPSGTSIVR